MRVRVKMPKLGLTMTQGAVLEWRKAVGQPVAASEILLVIETEKAEVEVETPVAGTLVEILVGPGGSAPVGDPIAVIETSGGDPAPDADA